MTASPIIHIIRNHTLSYISYAIIIAPRMTNRSTNTAKSSANTYQMQSKADHQRTKSVFNAVTYRERN